jgi:hypothetical protein
MDGSSCGFADLAVTWSGTATRGSRQLRHLVRVSMLRAGSGPTGLTTFVPVALSYGSGYGVRTIYAFWTVSNVDKHNHMGSGKARAFNNNVYGCHTRLKT